MNRIIDKTDDIISVITESEKYKNYLYLKNKMINDKEIMKIIEEVKSLQKKIIKGTYNNRDVSLLEKNISDNMNLLNNYPLYVEFNYTQEDLNEVFQYIKNTIQDNINNILK